MVSSNSISGSRLNYTKELLVFFLAEAEEQKNKSRTELD